MAAMPSEVLPAHVDAIVDGLLRQNERRWESLSAADRERVEALARDVAARLVELTGSVERDRR
jgi:hypothetical protein